jgi:F0F1-type ATP synthase membrane subunit c/vacuolar-type H+-ATPase subunit K
VTAPAGPSIEEALRTSRIIHAALVFSVVIYAVVAHYYHALGASPALDASQVGVIRLAFYALAGALALAALAFRHRLTVAAAAPPLVAVQTRMIVCMALAEAIAILGMVLVFIGGGIRDFYVFAIPAVALQLLFAPRREAWEDAVRSRGVRSR